MLNSRRKLKPSDADRLSRMRSPLFQKLARIVCETGVFPEKELHECWELAEIVQQQFSHAKMMVDAAAGHGLLAWILVLLDSHSPRAVGRKVAAVDISKPPSAEPLKKAILNHWPELDERVCYVEASVASLNSLAKEEIVFVGNHACGPLSDIVLLSAMASHASLVLMPCCHSFSKQKETLACLTQSTGLILESSEVVARAIDNFRSEALRSRNYEVREMVIDPGITACNRVIVAESPRLRSEDVRAIVRPPFPLAKRSGEIRAYELLEQCDVSDWNQLKILANRPSRIWRRVFDLSYWTETDQDSTRILDAIQVLPERASFDFSSKILGEFSHPNSDRRSVTIRVEMISSRVAMSKEDALVFRSEVCAHLAKDFSLRT